MQKDWSHWQTIEKETKNHTNDRKIMYKLSVSVRQWILWNCNCDSNACPKYVLCSVKMPTCFLPLQTSGHDLGTVAGGCDSPVDKQRSAVEEDSEARCGWCFFRPLFLQRFRTAKWVLFWLCWAGAVQGKKVSYYCYCYWYCYLPPLCKIFTIIYLKQTIF
jgi:hypothetical protein